ncbi:ABC-type spermidine/putrescine transport system permease subunit I [Halarchaeum solikamskense]|uniref:ABC transporter permease n=1 Tax=Halarchaeum nitratireducens TaxID=489913 RepID=UPI001B3AA0A7|nr:ABC transporter permease [Halarchaeum solikamskense]MBP2249728.1 ABC-type spermidine/putrescine transport system permease subunit I [Halarchaeum solikamskense]
MTDTTHVDADDRRAFTGSLPSPKYLVASYPVAMLVVLFGVPFCLLLVFSFYQNVEGGYFAPGFTLENYARFLTSDLYLGRTLFTFEVSVATALACLVLGYPLAYYLARLDGGFRRQAYLTTVVSTLWLTFIIRGYAWQVLLGERGIVTRALAALGFVPSGEALTPGLGALLVGMIYVFLPFMVLSLYTTIKDIDRSLEEASRNLGAGPVTTFLRVTLPLSKNGIASGTTLVFILSLGVYVLPRLLGGPSQWTLPVLIGNQVGVEGNVPFGAAISVVLVVFIAVVVGGVALIVRDSDPDPSDAEVEA